MFESIVGGRRAERRLGSGAFISIALHAALVALAIWFPNRDSGGSGGKGVAVTFFVAPSKVGAGPGAGGPAPAPEPAPAPLPAPAAALERQARLKETRPTPPKTKTHAEEKKAPEEKPEPKVTDTKVQAPESTKASPAVTSNPGDKGAAPNSSGEASGTPGGTGRGAQVGSTSGSGSGTGSGTGTGTGVGSGTGPGTGRQRFEVLPFGPGMTRPKLLSGRTPVYTRAALIAKVEGTVLAQCVITVQGTLTGCRIIKGQPHMDEAVLSALSTFRYTPTTYQGQIVSVRYVITIKLKLPD